MTKIEWMSICLGADKVKQSHYASNMVGNMRNIISLFVLGSFSGSDMEGRKCILIEYMDIIDLKIHGLLVKKD